MDEGRMQVTCPTLWVTPKHVWGESMAQIQVSVNLHLSPCLFTQEMFTRCLLGMFP